jgi:hypothetical protein
MSPLENNQDLFDAVHSPASENGLHERLQADIRAAGGPVPADPDLAGAIGVTMFDLPGSEDQTVTVLLPREKLQQAPAQALVRIKSRNQEDGRIYLGMVTAGPFAELDSLRGDSPLLDGTGRLLPASLSRPNQGDDPGRGIGRRNALSASIAAFAQ